MNKADLVKMISEPGSLGKSELLVLNKAESDFPWFQGIHVLLARALSNLNHYDFQKQLHKTSLIVPDREILYKYIHDIKQTDSKDAEIKLVIPEVEQVITQPEITIEEPVVELKQEIITSPEVHVVENVTEEPKSEIKEENHSIDEISVIEIEQIPEESIKVVDLEEHNQEKHSFFEWLELAQGKQPEVKAEINEFEPKPKIEGKEEQVLTENKIEAKVVEKEAEVKSNVVQFENILDKFIRESPSISRPKTAFYSPANMAKQSVAEDEDLVTETLAKLYHKQGHHKKAIRAYEKLCLIYPHKMAYFADLIQQIKLESKD